LVTAACFLNGTEVRSDWLMRKVLAPSPALLLFVAGLPRAMPPKGKRRVETAGGDHGDDDGAAAANPQAKPQPRAKAKLSPAKQPARDDSAFAAAPHAEEAALSEELAPQLFEEDMPSRKVDAEAAADSKAPSATLPSANAANARGAPEVGHAAALAAAVAALAASAVQQAEQQMVAQAVVAQPSILSSDDLMSGLDAMLAMPSPMHRAEAFWVRIHCRVFPAFVEACTL